MKYLLVALFLGLAGASPDQNEALKSAKVLFFDHKYEEARTLWQSVQKASTGGDADEALYWIARCSEGLGESERAFSEYGMLLDHRSADPGEREEAQTRRVAIATKLYKAGTTHYLSVLTSALADPSKTVRYFAAFQVSGLPGDVARQAVPVLREILANEKDPDIVERAKILVLRLDPKALGTEAAPRGNKVATWLRVRITKAGKTAPEVSVNVPVALAELLFKSLPDDAKADLRKKGYDADNFWERLKTLGPTSVVHIEGEDGEKIDIFLE